MPAVRPLRPRAANDFEALGRLRKLAFAEAASAPKVVFPLDLASGSPQSTEDGDAPSPV